MPPLKNILDFQTIASWNKSGGFFLHRKNCQCDPRRRHRLCDNRRIFDLEVKAPNPTQPETMHPGRDGKRQRHQFLGAW